MPTREQKVREFCQTAGQAVDSEITEDLVLFRLRLLKEEVREVEGACDVLLYEHMCGKGASREARAELLKELCDVQYVLSGMLVALGLDHSFDAAFNRVHQSNLSKFPATYAPDGKVMKGPNYKPPFLEDLL